jgi:hypothetical protein
MIGGARPWGCLQLETAAVGPQGLGRGGIEQCVARLDLGVMVQAWMSLMVAALPLVPHMVVQLMGLAQK